MEAAPHRLVDLWWNVDVRSTVRTLNRPAQGRRRRAKTVEAGQEINWSSSSPVKDAAAPSICFSLDLQRRCVALPVNKCGGGGGGGGGFQQANPTGQTDT